MTPHPGTRRATEAECQAAIVQAALLAGWMVHAERPAKNQRGKWLTNVQGQPGWPDLVLVKGGRCIIVELKRRPNMVEPGQVLWLRKLRLAGMDARVVWVPEGMDAFIAELVNPLERAS